MRIKRTVLLRYLFVGVLFPFFLQYVIYYRFTPNYQVGVLSDSGFVKGNERDIFRYRVLGAALQRWVYHKIVHSPAVQKVNAERDKIYDARLLVLDRDADLIFYFTYFLLSTVFAILTALCVLRLFEMKQFFVISDQLKILVTMVLTFLIGITQFVLTPYDVPSYFFMSLSLVLFLKQIERKSTVYLVLLCIVIILATLTRESSLIILCFMAAVYIARYGLLRIRWILKMIWPALAFFIPYYGLRLYFGGNMQNISQVTFLLNFEFNHSKNVMALIFFFFWLYFCFQLAASSENRKLIRTFLLLSTPYIVMIFVAGLIIEIRLWMPLILGSVVLAFINYNSLRKSEPESGPGRLQAKPQVSA